MIPLNLLQLRSILLAYSTSSTVGCTLFASDRCIIRGLEFTYGLHEDFKVMIEELDAILYIPNTFTFTMTAIIQRH